MDTTDKVAAQQQMLAREMREMADDVEDFERANSIPPNFRHYYRNYLGDSRVLDRTFAAALTRRRAISGFVERLRSSLGESPLVLDVGCGYGTDSLLLASLGCRVVATDPTEDYIAVAKFRLAHWRQFLDGAPEPEFTVGRVEDRHDLESAGFDGVYTAECLHHCEPVENALLEIRRVVREDGSVLVLESNAANPAVRWKRDRMVTGPRRILDLTGDVYSLVGNEAIRTPRTWRAIFHTCGFEVVTEDYSRHVLSELTGSAAVERIAAKLPGAAVAAIHVAFELRTRSADYVADVTQGQASAHGGA